MNLDNSFSPEPDNQPSIPSSNRRKWIIGISIGVGVLLLLGLVGQFSGLLGARLIRQGSPRLTVYQAETVTLEIPSSEHVQKLEICDDKETRILFGYRDFKRCSTLSYFINPGTTQATVRIPTNYEGRAVVVVRQRGSDNRLLAIAPRDAKIALWVNKARPQPAQQADSGGGSGGGGGGGGSGGNGGDSGGGDRDGDGFNPTPPPTTASIHISYYDNLNRDLKYATNISGSWVASTIDSTGFVGDYSDLAVDSNGRIHISYHDNTYEDVKYITNASGSWVTETPDPTGETGFDTSIVLDSNNKVHISYFDAYADFAGGTETSDLNYATNASGSWVVTTIDSNGRVGADTAIAIDGNNKVHISYYDATSANQDLKYATNASGSWVTVTVDSENGAATDFPLAIDRQSSIAIDSQNKAHISYVTYTGDPTPDNLLLKYATNVSGNWVANTVDPSGSAQYTSLVLDSSDKAHISYYENRDADLRYATNTSGSWVTSAVDSTGDVGKFSAIAMDNQGKLHISYYDQSRANLKYATDTSGSWATSTVDSTGILNSYTSIGSSQ